MTAAEEKNRARRPRGKIGYRLYLVGLLQFLLVAAATITFTVFSDSPVSVGTILRTQDMVEGALPHLHTQAQLAAHLAVLKEKRGLDISFYDEQNQLVASNVTPPLPPKSSPSFTDHAETLIVVPYESGEKKGYAVGKLQRVRPPPWRGFFIYLLSAVTVMAVGSFLTARWLVRPLEKLAQTANALGSGDLNARVSSDRTDEFGAVGRAFDEMVERIGALLKSEKELLANVSHELRTPLSRIHVAVDLATEGDQAASRAALASITEDLSELERLVEDILTAARLQLTDTRAATASFSLHVEPMEMSTLVARSQERFQTQHPERALTVSVPDFLPVVHVDPILMRRVIENLLENAFKYSADSGAPIQLRALREGTAAKFQVEDRGMGIAAEDLPHLFTPFFRSERSRSRGTGGVGLGLTLAKRVVEAHGGDIVIDSEVGVGTTVTVTLPLTG